MPHICHNRVCRLARRLKPTVALLIGLRLTTGSVEVKFSSESASICCSKLSVPEIELLDPKPVFNEYDKFTFYDRAQESLI